MTDQESTMLSIQIVGKFYDVKCPTDQVQTLQQAAQFLDIKMRDIRNNFLHLNEERLAIMAALNITSELLQMQKLVPENNEELAAKIKNIQHKIHEVLTPQESLPL